MLRPSLARVGTMGRGALSLMAGRGARSTAAAAAAGNDRASSKRSQHVVVSLAGADRVGLVHEFTKTALAHDANVEETRMARLGGEFAIIGMLSLEPATQMSAVVQAYEKAFPGFNVACRQTTSQEDAESATAGQGHQEWSLDLEGPDSPGIVASISEELAKTGSSIHQMDTETTTAPFAGFVLFKLSATFSVSPSHVDDVLKAMTAVEEKYGVAITMARAADGDAPNPSAA